MRLKKHFTKFMVASLAAFFAVAGISDLSEVRATEAGGTTQTLYNSEADEYPEEVFFPIQVLDFWEDDLFFEWGGNGNNNGDCDLDLYGPHDAATEEYYKRIKGITDENFNYNQADGYGMGLLEETLGPDGYPQYKQSTVERLAGYVQVALNHNDNTFNLDSPFKNSVANPMSVRNYIQPDWCIFEAEDGVLSNGNVTVEQRELASNGAFVDFHGGHGDIDFTIYSSQAGTRRIYLFFATADNRHVNISVNGQAHDVTCTSNNSWDKPSVLPVYADVVLRQGANTIKLTDINNGVMPNIDRFAIVKQGFEYNVGPTDSEGWTLLEAENGDIQGTQGQDGQAAGKVNGGVGTSGGAYVTGLGGANNNSGRVTFRYYAQEDGDYTIQLYYATGNDRSFRVTIDGVEQDVLCNSSTAMDVVAAVPATVTVQLETGLHDIVIGGAGDVAPNLDCIKVKSDSFVTIEAEDGTLGGGAVVNDGDNNSNGKRVNNVGNGGTVTFKYNSPTDGKKTLELFYASNEVRSFGVSVNGALIDHAINCPSGNSLVNTTAIPVICEIEVKEGENTIVIGGFENGTAPNLDKIRIRDYRIGDGTNNAFPLGDYAESKAKFDGNPDLGWKNITTCMDYAYFVTSNLFKPNATLNSQYLNYNNLIFHKVPEYEKDANGNDRIDPETGKPVETGKALYEFAADQAHMRKNGEATSKYDLVYNDEDKTIRNAIYQEEYKGAEQGERQKEAGKMFIADDLIPSYNGLSYFQSIDDWDGKAHNFHYTISSHSKFIYKSGGEQYFYFSGDDDVYVFVNGRLLVDLGGAHVQLDGEFALDKIVASINNNLAPEDQIVDGRTCTLDFFYVERHSRDSNFYAKMNFKLANDKVEFQLPSFLDLNSDIELPYGYPLDLNYHFVSGNELSTNKNLTFTDDLGNTIGTRGLVLGPETQLGANKTITVRIKKAEYKDPNNPNAPVEKDKVFTYTYTFKNVKEFDQDDQKTIDELVKLFQDTQLEQDDEVWISGLIFDSSKRDFESYNDTGDVNVRQMYFNTKAQYDSDLYGVNRRGEATQSISVKLLTGKLVITTKVEGNQKTDLALYGKFVVNRNPSDNTYSVEDTPFYENDVNLAKTDTITKNEVPWGTYTMNLDMEYLTGYTVTVQAVVYKTDDENVVESVVEGELVRTMVNGTPKDEIKEVITDVNGNRKVTDNKLDIQLDMRPDYKNGRWEYKKIEFRLKAIRQINPLVDLT